MTLMQVFSSSWYPSFEYDAPILGINFLSLNSKGSMVVVDFQPLYATQEYEDKYLSPLKALKEKYPAFQSSLSGKHYQGALFFSKHMLFGRFADEREAAIHLKPLFTEVLETYRSLVESTVPFTNPDDILRVESKQREYDEYFSTNDAGIGIYKAYFQKEWAEEYVHGYKFPLSRIHHRKQSQVHNFYVTSSGEIETKRETVVGGGGAIGEGTTNPEQRLPQQQKSTVPAPVLEYV